MKKLILFSFIVLGINGIVSAQAQNGNIKRSLCEDCSRFPYKPTGCDNTNCLEQLLSTATRQELRDYFTLPDNITDKIIYTRNRGVRSMHDYKAALEPYEYRALMDAYDKYVALRNPK